MNIQLEYQGQFINVPIEDENATFQYLYKQAQNRLKSQVQLFYTLPDRTEGLIDPSWSITQYVKAGAKFFVFSTQQGKNILVNIFLQDRQIKQENVNLQSTLKEVVEYVNSNMQALYQESELYDWGGNRLTSKQTDTFQQFTQAQQPFLLFIPKCQQGITSFVQQQQKILIDVYYLNQKYANVSCGHQQIMQELLNFVNKNTNQQDTTFELFDAQGNRLSNNLQDIFGKFSKMQQPLQFYVQKCGYQKADLNTQYPVPQKDPIRESVAIQPTMPKAPTMTQTRQTIQPQINPQNPQMLSQSQPYTTDNLQQKPEHLSALNSSVNQLQPNIQMLRQSNIEIQPQQKIIPNSNELQATQKLGSSLQIPIPEPIPIPKPIQNPIPIPIPTRNTLPLPQSNPTINPRSTNMNPMPMPMPIPIPAPQQQPNYPISLPQGDASQNIIPLPMAIPRPSMIGQVGTFETGKYIPIPSSIKQQVDVEKINSLQDNFVILTNLSLIIDESGNFVIYKFHFPHMVQGRLRKENSRNLATIPKSHFEWKKRNSISFAEIDDYGFAIEWDNKNISSVRISVDKTRSKEYNFK